MYLRTLTIQNFRALRDIELRTVGTPTAIVIVGPNAVGKSTVLEALRFLKSLLSPSFDQEQETTLRDMSVLVPGERRFDMDEIASDPTKRVRISADFHLSDEDILKLRKFTPQWARVRLANKTGAQGGTSDIGLVQFLSSDEGRAALKEAQTEVETELDKLASDPYLRPALQIDSRAGALGERLFDQEALSLLSSDSGYTAFFNYFPADRALPSGDVSIQIGAGDLQQTRISHIAKPSSKYERFKQHLVTRYLFGDSERAELTQDFKSVFEGLLFDKELHALHLTRKGRLNVIIRDRISGATYDIDRMSSGEKGLLLTLFLLKRTTQAGGLALLDEPELHLNSAVCNRLLGYLVDHVLRPQRLQAIICTHSEEVLAHAYRSEDCELFHLRASDNLSRIELSDRDELSTALRALGTTTLDGLFSAGTLYVEGTDDVMLMQSGFASHLAKWQLVPLNGRREVEKTIQDLQKAEGSGALTAHHSFIFDRDRTVTHLNSTPLVRLRQLPRYCLENFLLDADALHDAIRDTPRDPAVVLSRGDVTRRLRELALSQIPSVVTQMTYAALEPENAGLRPAEVRNETDYRAIAGVLAARLTRIASSFANYHADRWISDFVSRAAELTQTLNAEWESTWALECNGKLVLRAVHGVFGLRIDHSQFKCRVMRKLQERTAESYQELTAILGDLTATRIAT